MDWTNIQSITDLIFGLVAPQIFEDHQRRSEEAQAATLERGKARSQVWLKVLDEHFLGTDNPYLRGVTITLADFHAAPFVALVEVIGSDLSAHPRISRWLGRMKALKSWSRVNRAIDDFATGFKGRPMISVWRNGARPWAGMWRRTWTV